MTILPTNPDSRAKLTMGQRKLGEVCDFIFGYSFRADDFNEVGKGLPVIRIGDIDKGITEKFYDKEYDDRYLIEKGDVLIGLSGSIKVDKWKGERALLNQRIVKIRDFKPEVLEDFVFYQLPQILKRLEIQISQGTVKNVLLPHLSNLKILVPPLKIQQKIVERLDVIKKAQELNDKQIALADELFQSLLRQELDPKGKKWEVKKLEEIANITSGGTPSRKRPEYFEGKIPWVKSGELKDDEIHRTEEYITEEGLKNSSAKLFPVNTILVAMYGATVGKTGILKVPATTNQAIASTQVNPKIVDYNFIYFILRTKMDFLLSRRFGGAQPNINQSIIQNLKISFPPIETQRKIVEKLSAVQEYKKKFLEQKQKLQELFDSVLHKSMKGEI